MDERIYIMLVNFFVTIVLGGAVKYWIDNSVKKRIERTDKDLKATLIAQQLRNNKIERVYIAITAVERGLEAAPGINGHYTEVKNRVKKELEDNSDILNQPLIT